MERKKENLMMLLFQEEDEDGEKKEEEDFERRMTMMNCSCVEYGDYYCFVYGQWMRNDEY